jgi:uncharacterized protein YutE (UPF0331/DUF86 family)
MNYEMISDRVAIINKAVSRLEKMRELALKDFLQDEDNLAIAEHNVRIALEGIFDIGRHIVVKSGMGKPEDYRQILVILSQNKIIPIDFFEKIKGIAGYRNRLFHLYNEVTGEELYEIVKNKLDDIKEYVKYILNYIKQNKI